MMGFIGFIGCVLLLFVFGWCDSGNLGLMMINECPKCGTKYRFHGTTTGRWNLDSFIGDLYTQLSIQK